MVIKKIEDRKIDLQAAEYADEAGEIFSRIEKSLPDLGIYDLTESNIKQESIRIHRKFHQTANFNVVKKAVDIAAALILVFTAIFAVCVFQVDAFREQVIEVLFHTDNTHVSIHGPGGVYLYLEDSCLPEYIPEEFVQTDLEKTEQLMMAEYCSEEQYFTFTQQNGSYCGDVDTENADIDDTIKVSGRPALLIQKEDTVCLLWDTEKNSFMIQGNISKELLVRIAQSVPSL